MCKVKTKIYKTLQDVPELLVDVWREQYRERKAITDNVPSFEEFCKVQYGIGVGPLIGEMIDVNSKAQDLEAITIRQEEIPEYELPHSEEEWTKFIKWVIYMASRYNKPVISCQSIDNLKELYKEYKTYTRLGDVRRYKSI